jgi:molybdenum cofactor cytidylyltransferase
MPKSLKISAVLLAAGASRRLGRNKLLLEVGGRPVVRRVAEALLGAEVSEVIVVTGHEAEAVRRALGGLEVRLVHNPRFAEGQVTSLAAGLARGDQPFLTEALVNALVRAFAGAAPPPLAAAPFFGDRRGTPTLFSAELRGDLARLQGDEGGRSILARVQEESPEQFLAVPWEEERAFLDLDTEEAYENLLAETEGRAPD